MVSSLLISRYIDRTVYKIRDTVDYCSQVQVQKVDSRLLYLAHSNLFTDSFGSILKYARGEQKPLQNLYFHWLVIIVKKLCYILMLF